MSGEVATHKLLVACIGQILWLLRKRLAVTPGCFYAHILDLTIYFMLCNCSHHVVSQYIFTTIAPSLHCRCTEGKVKCTSCVSLQRNIKLYICMHLQWHCPRRGGSVDIWNCRRLTSFFYAVVVRVVYEVAKFTPYQVKILIVIYCASSVCSL